MAWLEVVEDDNCVKIEGDEGDFSGCLVRNVLDRVIEE